MRAIFQLRPDGGITVVGFTSRPESDVPAACPGLLPFLPPNCLVGWADHPADTVEWERRTAMLELRDRARLELR